MWNKSLGIAVCLLGLAACSSKDKNVVDGAADSTAVIDTTKKDSLATDSTTIDSTLLGLDSNFVGVGKGILLDNFEDSLPAPLVGGGWYTYLDASNGGGSLITNLSANGDLGLASPGYYSKGAMDISVKLEKGTLAYAPYIGFGLTLDRGAASPTKSMAAFGGISYYYKGCAHIVRVEASDVTDYDVHMITVPASKVWKKVSLPFATFKQEGWGIPIKLNKENIQNISWQIKGATGFTDSLQIDNLYLGDTSEIKVIRVEDLGAPKQPEIPVVTPLASIVISNPMQALATKLDKGVNITNWLEEDGTGFKSFKFGESDVQKWSKNGFKALRLPVDLDQYVVDRKGYLAGTAEFAVKDSLYIVLDSFDIWTARYGMSLTIDYHEYDKGFNAITSKDPVYISMMTRLWKDVAKHFATSSRDDIFFELMNEPDNTILAADWGTVAQGMIDSIRSVNTNNAIIFGDVNYYSFSTLVNRKPFTDAKMIYAIHYYDPFLFTHQGASWTDMKNISGIPFPYDPAKWSTSSADLGYNTQAPAWVKTQIVNYYKNGNKEAQMIQIQKAKKWAVDNNVPVIMNEFGSYDLVADPASRLNFYSAITSICKELEIPWQHWGVSSGFQLFSSTGDLLPGMKDALGL